MGAKVIMAAGGGHGTMFIASLLSKKGYRVTIRPEAAFDVGFEIDFNRLPTQQEASKWQMRTKRRIDRNKSICENILCLAGCNDIDIIVSGPRLSSKNSFLTETHLPALCIVRHPLNAYYSVMSRHDRLLKKIGAAGIEDPIAIKWFADRWNKAVSDFLDSGNRIWRYEYTRGEIPCDTIEELIIQNWNSSSKHYDKVSNEMEALMAYEVAPLYNRLYMGWRV